MYKCLILHANKEISCLFKSFAGGTFGIIIEKTDVAYFLMFPCIVVKKTFKVTCGDPETEVDLILSWAGIFEKISMILQFAPLIDQISVPVLGGFVVPLVDIE